MVNGLSVDGPSMAKALFVDGPSIVKGLYVDGSLNDRLTVKGS